MSTRAVAVIVSVAVLFAAGIVVKIFFLSPKANFVPVQNDEKQVWKAPELNSLPNNDSGALIRYGRELIAHTSIYFGPKGKIAHITNGMNCQNCHLDAGTKGWGNNYFAVASTYPKFRSRSGKIESIVRRIDDCFERSLNGTIPDSDSKEMKAMVAYMQWLGTGVAHAQTPEGTGIHKLGKLSRSADTLAGKNVFLLQCQSCHHADGQGVLESDGAQYVYPPLWGPHSYNVGAGLYRISNFAGYIHDNMPFGTDYVHPTLTEEQSWDVAAYVNSQPRPKFDTKNDWKDVSKKPFDCPYGPYADSFSALQHKYGPFITMTKN